ncbi:hypothetical protein GYMLUDRAFT_372136 [Collybiopsis luxurians FD-317 M1]|uniref:Uncharacterized protein n=1 Tax=Collybiopsis luxurians FD-317 M1 TaxID=944289 RepID=A0A0D0C2I6_9AGAR|nr:hypothetical protein GYMLUDRAFT_372136 [Collybiopsis luxurians FD-317 M1]
MADFPDPSLHLPPKSNRNSLSASHSFPRSSSTSSHTSVTGTPLVINTNTNISKPYNKL